ncbi:MAG: formylglycine-generating enzyme family protein [Planctomycetaceae bacterium]|nr:formylglycine-generating enzyme family protein [Planctomycetaceae bacterium]
MWKLVMCLVGLAVGCGRSADRIDRNSVARALSSEQRAVGEPVVNSIGMVLVPIPTGRFVMGDVTPQNEDASAGEIQRTVHITRPFSLGIHEVTQEQYARVTGKDPSYFKGTTHPVDSVSWREAVYFCRLLSDLPAEKAAGRSYRLPTEAEWEYACRAGSTSPFSCGSMPECPEDSGWIAGNSESRTHPVGAKSPNPWGLYDMHGNVWEWCQDWYAELPDPTDEPVDDPRGPPAGEGHVVRGGAFTNPADSVRSTTRYAAGPDFRLFSNGFRVVMVLPTS